MVKNDQAESLEEKKAGSFLLGMIVLGIVLYVISPKSWSGDLRGGIFLFCLAIGLLGQYMPEQRHEITTWVVGIFKAFIKRLFPSISSD